MTFPARIILLAALLSLCAACAALQPDTSLPARFDVHNPESNAAIWGAGD
jgi:hypothetical protein